MKTHWAIALALTLVASSAIAADKDEDKPSFWMQKKMDYSTHILGGLANQDFAAIAENAKAMKNLNQIERWVRGNKPGYRTQLDLFKNANDQLIRMADDKNLDGAVLAYVQLTLSCVNCHKIVRDAR